MKEVKEMLYTYTPEDVGGRIIVDFPTGKFQTQELYFEGNFVSVRERENDGLIIIQVFDTQKNRFTKIISNVELNFQKHEMDDYYFPVIE